MKWLKRLFGRKSKPSPIRRFFKGNVPHAVVPCGDCNGEIEMEWLKEYQIWAGYCDTCQVSFNVDGPIPLDDLIDQKTNRLVAVKAKK